MSPLGSSGDDKIHEVFVRAERGEQGVRLRVYDMFGHDGEGELALDLDAPMPGGDGTWREFLARYGAHHSTPAQRRAFGDALFGELMQREEIGAAWTGIIGAAQRRPLRMMAEFHAGSEAVFQLPLELLRGVDGDLFARPDSGLVRTLAGETAREFVMPPAPRVLFAWARAHASGDFDAQPHVDQLSAIYGAALDVLPNATLAQIEARLAEAARANRPYQFVQILAHGTQLSSGFGIVLRNEWGSTTAWPAQRFAEKLRGHGVELVFLCSCQSGIGFAGVGQQVLAQTGADVPCVVACQADLPIAGSAELAGRFHLLLRATRDPALALARARRDAYDAGDAWSVPVLLQRAAMPAPPTGLPELFGLPRRGLTWQSRGALEDAVVAALRTNRLVAVVGLPGIGKTQVSDEAARRVRLDGLCDAATYLAVTPAGTPEHVTSLLAASLGHPEIKDIAALGALLDARGSRLLVLDNAEDLMRDPATHARCRSFVAALLANTQHLRVLLSTRWPSGVDGEVVVAVDPMPDAEADALLRREFAAHEVVLTPAQGPEHDGAWSRLIAHLRGHPRAIHLVAARFAGSKVAAAAVLTAVEAALASTAVHWTLLGSQHLFAALPAPQLQQLRTLAAALDMALDHLAERDAEAVTALHRLALFPAGLPERTAMLVAGGHASIALQRLYRQQLVDWRDGRAHLPEPSHAHLKRKRPADFDAEPAWAAVTLGLAQHAHACHNQMTAGDIRGGVARFVADLETVLELAPTVAGTTDRPWTRAFAHMVSPAVEILNFADELDTSKLTAECGVQVAMHHRDVGAAANCLRSLGDLRMRVQDLDGARAAYEQALPIYRQIRDRLGEANCLQSLGDLRTRVDDLDGARAAYEQALPIYRQIRDRLGEANCLKSLGDLRRRVQDLDGARAAYEQALPIYRQIRERLGEANCLKSLGDLRRRVDDLDGARAAYELALPIYREIRERLGEANCLKSLGDLRMRVQDLDGARAAYEQALPIYRQIRDRLGEANCLQSLGDLRMRVQDLDGARAAYEQALPIYREIRERLGEANCLEAMALYDLQGGKGAAFAKLVAVLPLREEVLDQLGAQATFGYLARAAGAAGALDHALVLSERSIAIGRRIDDRFGQTITLELQVQVFSAQKEFAGALACMVLHRQLSEAMRDPGRAAKYVDVLTQVERAHPAEWRALAASAEQIRAAAVAAAEQRLRARGEDPLRLPGQPA